MKEKKEEWRGRKKKVSPSVCLSTVAINAKINFVCIDCQNKTHHMNRRTFQLSGFTLKTTL